MKYFNDLIYVRILEYVIIGILLLEIIITVIIRIKKRKITLQLKKKNYIKGVLSWKFFEIIFKNIINYKQDIQLLLIMINSISTKFFSCFIESKF